MVDEEDRDVELSGSESGRLLSRVSPDCVILKGIRAYHLTLRFRTLNHPCLWIVKAHQKQNQN